MKTMPKMSLHRETLRHLDAPAGPAENDGARGSSTLLCTQ
jgi:hypothetical protein